MNWRQLAVLHFVLPILFNTTYIYYTHTNMTLRGARWREWKRGKRDNNACAIFCHSEDNFFARAKDASSTKNIKNCTRSTLTANWKQYQAMVDKISKTLLTVSLTDSPIWIQEMLAHLNMRMLCFNVITTVCLAGQVELKSFLGTCVNTGSSLDSCLLQLADKLK